MKQEDVNKVEQELNEDELDGVAGGFKGNGPNYEENLKPLDSAE
jgi:hypothetical protein